MNKLTIAFITYNVLLILRGTRTAQMLVGILIVTAAFILSAIIPLTTVNWVMNKFYSSFIILLFILFQEDIRHMLSRMGKKSILSSSDIISSNKMLDEITRSTANLASRKIGALIVIERNIILNRYIEVGTTTDARVSSQLLTCIFHPTSPIHDGAVIIQQGRISSAGCFLPLTNTENLDPKWGTRHRAAIGISEETDALVVLVSEERGTISLIVEGQVSRALEPEALRDSLKELIIDEDVLSEEKKMLAQQVKEGSKS